MLPPLSQLRGFVRTSRPCLVLGAASCARAVQITQFGCSFCTSSWRQRRTTHVAFPRLPGGLHRAGLLGERRRDHRRLWSLHGQLTANFCQHLQVAYIEFVLHRWQVCRPPGQAAGVGDASRCCFLSNSRPISLFEIG